MTDLKENSTGQTVYEQLQEIFNKCIELGWKPFNKYPGSNEKQKLHYIEKIFLDIDFDPIVAHYLFTKESLLMEFVEWKDTKEKIMITGLDTGDYERHTSQATIYNYIKMSMLTAEEKCNYFVNNAIIPTK